MRAVIFRRVLTSFALTAIVALCVDARLLQLPFIDRAPFARAIAPDRRWAAYPRFLEGVREHTAPGDTIAIVVPNLGWDDGYMYAYYRASYVLTGREVLPLTTPGNGRLPANFRAAKYVAAFGVRLRVPADVVWQGDRGALLRLRR